jgi:hypothetical protein
MALQLRRGTNAERLAMTPLIGELIYVTDYELVTLSVTAIDAGTDTLTSVAHGLAVNQQIKFQDASLNGLTLNQVYFVKTVPSSDTFTLSLTLGGTVVDITGTFTIPLVFAKTPTNAAGAPIGTGVSALWIGDGVTVGGIIAASLNLDDLLDVNITSLADGNSFYYDATTGFWRNTAIITVDDANNRIGINDTSPSFSLDVTGTANITSNLTVDTNTLLVDATNNRVGIRKTPDVELDVNGAAGISGNLNVDGGTLFVDASLNRVGVNNGSPSYALDVTGEIRLSGENLYMNQDDTGADVTVHFNTGRRIHWDHAAQRFEINGDTYISNDLIVDGGDITTTAGTATVFNTTATTVNIGGAATTMSIGNAAGTVTIPGNLTINGTTTNINTTNLLVEDKNITIGDVTTPTDVTAAGGGITLLGATNKTITWNNATDGWEFNQAMKVTGNIVAPSANIGVIDINITAGQIDTNSGSNLTLDSDGGTVLINDNLNVDSGVLYVDATNNYVGINDTTPSYPLDVNGIINTNSTVQCNDLVIDSLSTYNTVTTTTTSTSATSISSTTRASQKVVIRIIDNVSGDIHMLEALAFQKSTTAYLTTYAEMYTGAAALATFTADVSGGAIRILATPASTNSTTFTVARVSLD